MRQLNTYHSGMAGYLMDFGFGGTFETAKVGTFHSVTAGTFHSVTAGTFHSVTAGTSIPLFTDNGSLQSKAAEPSA